MRGCSYAFLQLHNRTFRRDCNAQLKLRASDDGTLLIVRNFCNKHNHPISRVSSILIICIYTCMSYIFCEIGTFQAAATPTKAHPS